jgi:hypothetical protein
MLAQGGALILGAENAAPLQVRDHQIDKLPQTIGKQRGDQVEAVGPTAYKPILDLIGDLSRCTQQHPVTADHIEAQDQLPGLRSAD